MKKDRIKLDTPSIMFTSLTSKTWGRTFGFCAVLSNGEIEPELVRQACRDIAPCYPHVFTNLRKGFFWNYQVPAGSEINLYEKSRRTIKPIGYRYDGKPDFRITWSGSRITFEAAHCLGDGKGLLRFFAALITRYAQLKSGDPAPFTPETSAEEATENSFDRYYQKDGERDRSRPEQAHHLNVAFHEGLPEIVYAAMPVDKVKEKAHEKRMTVTEYLAAVLILGVIRSEPEPIDKPVTVFVPVNLRRFFPSNTMRNFVVQTEIKFYPEGKRDYTLDFVCEKTAKRLKQQLTKEHLQAVVNKFGALAGNPAVGIVPNCVKRPVMRFLQRKGHEAATTIFTNLGQIELPEHLKDVVADLRFINGDTRYYGLASTVSCVSCGNRLNLCWSQATQDKRWLTECIAILNEEGVPAEILP
ncbi:MAG: hypothetical protein IJK89_08350 [Clostridia bacterium]|nr:hypothetical protein [Clostridia bacterium]